jgi:LCP family protein required for cell wall assembly
LAYAYTAGSKIFENGITGKTLLRTIYGKDQLKGESDDRINVLITGMGGANHPGGMLADSIMVVSIRPKEKQAAIISVPRDLLVKIPGHNEDKINAAFADGYNDYLNKNCNKKNTDLCKGDALAAGENLTSEVVSNILGIPIHYYVNADFSGFEKIIDQLGGVDIYVDKSIYDPLFPANDMVHYAPFQISAGQHHMDGVTALKYARSRETTSDFDRAERQHKVLEAIKAKALNLGFLTNPEKIISMTSTIGDSVKTDFSLSEIKSFASIIKDISTDQVISAVI